MFDGMNYFRQPTDSVSVIQFNTEDLGFVQLEYQVYSANRNVKVDLSTNTYTFPSSWFPAGKFTPNVKQGVFLPAGDHQFSLKYTCLNECFHEIGQYWTKLTVLEKLPVKAMEKSGLSSQRLWLDSPESRLKVSGTGPIVYDGANFYRDIKEPVLRLSWPTVKSATSVGFNIYASKNLKIILQVEGRTIMEKQVESKSWINPMINLVNHRKTDFIEAKIECEDKMPGCGLLYFANVGIQDAHPPSIFTNISIATTIILIVVLGWFFKYPSFSRK